MIRIGLDGRPLSRPTSGVARVIAEILRHTPATEGFSFHLFSHLPLHSDFADLPAKHIHWHTGQGYLARKGGLYFNFALPVILREHPVDLFWGSQQVLPLFLPQIPAVLTFYDLVAIFFPQAMRRLARYQQRVVQRYSIRRAGRILSISRQTQEDMIRIYGYPKERAKVALLGYTPPLSVRFKAPITRPFILSVSTLEPRKNYTTLLRAYRSYASFCEERGLEPLDLILAGRRGWESKEFYTLLDDCQRTGRVHVLENLSDGQLAVLYRNATFFCLPSLYEGFGLSALEALAAGQRVILSDIPSLHEIAGDDAVYVAPLDTGSWVQALLQMHEARGTPRGKKRKFQLSEWTWQRTAQIHWGAFREVLVER